MLECFLEYYIGGKGEVCNDNGDIQWKYMHNPSPGGGLTPDKAAGVRPFPAYCSETR